MASTAGSKTPRKVEYDGVAYQIVREGLAEILNPIVLTDEQGKQVDSSKGRKSEQQTVFYNPIQQFNRDLSILATRVFVDDLLASRKQRHGKRRHDANPSKQKSTIAGTATEGAKNDKSKREMKSKRKRDETDHQGVEEEDRFHKKLKENDKQQDPMLSSSADLESPAARLLEAQSAEILARMDFRAEVMNVSSAEKPLEAARDGSRVDVNSSTADGNGGIRTRPGLQTNSETSLLQIRILDALSATGLRALRYAKEIPQVTSVIANDLSPAATKAIALNIKHNEEENKVTTSIGDAIQRLSQSKRIFEVIDLDPYGTAAPFLDSAVRALVNGGLLCVTSTDAGVFASVGYPEKAFSLYGGLPMKGPHSHEAGLRLILHTIATSAARYGLAIEPLLSLSIDFYIRVFVRVRMSPQEVKFLASKTMVVYNCDSGCGTWSKQFLAKTKELRNKKGDPIHDFSLAQAPTASLKCEECGFKTHLAGPMWGGPIQNPYFIQKMLDLLPTLSPETYQTIPRMEGMLSNARDETLLSGNEEPKSSECKEAEPTTLDGPTFSRIPPQVVDHHPFFFLPSALAGIIHCQGPSTDSLRGALVGLNYRVTRSHIKPGSLRTDAPWSVVWEIMREWVRQKAPLKEVRRGTAAWGIMQKDRSNSKLKRAKAGLRQLLEEAEPDVDTMKTELQSMLWTLEQEQVKDTEAEEKANKARQLENLEVVFDENLGRQSGEKKMVRYQLNPRPNWGPMSRAKGDQAP